MMKIKREKVQGIDFTLVLSRVDPSNSIVMDLGGERSFGFPGDQRDEIYLDEKSIQDI